MITKQMAMRDFHILADAKGSFMPIDEVCQFLYKRKLITVTTAGLSQGACQTEVSVFSKDGNGNYTIEDGRYYTVEDAIDSIIEGD